MKLSVILPTCLLILIGLLIFASMHHSAPPIPPAPTPVASTPPENAHTQSPPPGAISPVPYGAVGSVEGGIRITPAIQLPLNARPPIACSSDTRGTIALNAAVQLCLCDGAGWKLVNSDKSCTWKTNP